MQRDVGAAEEVGAAVEIGALGNGVKTEFALAEAGFSGVASGFSDHLIEEGIFGCPKVGVGDGDGLGDGDGFAGGEADLRFDAG